jgi:hypothetical protein
LLDSKKPSCRLANEILLAIGYALYVGIGVSMTIHWLSDFVAGAILGTVIRCGGWGEFFAP